MTMKMSRSIALITVSFLAGCAGQPTNQAATGPARSTGIPFDVNNRELETPNSLPQGFTTINPMAPDTGVIGVTHSVP